MIGFCAVDVGGVVCFGLLIVNFKWVADVFFKQQISGQDKPLPNNSNGNVSESNLNNKSRLHIVSPNNVEYAHQSMRLSAPCPVDYSHGNAFLAALWIVK